MTVDYTASDWLDVSWSEWMSLNPADDYLSQLPTCAGVYRIRHLERDGLEYIGETGRSTRGRVRSLARGTYASKMPYRDPHTAAPCLWAVRQEEGPEFEVSVTTHDWLDDKQSRKAFEMALIADYRRTMGKSTTANFGRIIPGYKQSSYRSGGVQGGPLKDGESEPQAAPGVSPLPRISVDNPLESDWMGLEWTKAEQLSDANSSIPTTNGLYRIWRDGDVPPLEYIGQSTNLRSRLYTHRNNRSAVLQYSYATLDEHDAPHKREEVETDLIGTHWLVYGEPPRDQF
ncbi:hypothetical protein C5C07_19735 [Haloferax sp. Atlit-4N]|nr:hypothetical protein C5C07_19735 [Haloferax sp. Atlit-4N]